MDLLKKEIIKTAIYPRVSTSDQMETGQSFDAQEAEFKRKCQETGREFVKSYKGEGDVKDDRSASIKDETIGIKIENHKLIATFDLRKRPNFEQMLLDAPKGIFNEVMFFKWDRFSRNVPFMYLSLIYLRRCGIELYPTHDTKDPLAIGFMSIINQTESEKTSQRVSLTLKKKFEDGVFPSIRMPYGYKWNKVTKSADIEPKEAIIVKSLFDGFRQGKSAKELSLLYKIPVGNVYFIIRNRAYYGIIEFDGLSKIGKHNPIVSEEEWREANGRG